MKASAQILFSYFENFQNENKQFFFNFFFVKFVKIYQYDHNNQLYYWHVFITKDTLLSLCMSSKCIPPSLACSLYASFVNGKLILCRQKKYIPYLYFKTNICKSYKVQYCAYLGHKKMYGII